jgi:hypothetical protein
MLHELCDVLVKKIVQSAEKLKFALSHSSAGRQKRGDTCPLF